MDVSQTGLALIKSFEGLRLAAYKDLVGIWTIGYGHTGPDVTMGRVISSETADALLAKDVADCARSVSQLVLVPISQNQFDALVDFGFNLGVGKLSTSTLLKCVNQKDFKGAADEFLRWNKAGGKVVAGLAKRRSAERDLFLKDS